MYSIVKSAMGRLRIGKPGWEDALLRLSKPLGPDFWSYFTPVPRDTVGQLEAAIGRKLPADFVEFYVSVGYGQFPVGGGIDSPSEILAGLAAPIYFMTGSLTPGAEWCSEEDHRALWLSRAVNNPLPQRFTPDVLQLGGVWLFDLLQFGSNGACCYHHLHLPEGDPEFGYCLLTDSQTIEDRRPTFSDGLVLIIDDYIAELSERE